MLLMRQFKKNNTLIRLKCMIKNQKVGCYIHTISEKSANICLNSITLELTLYSQS